MLDCVGTKNSDDESVAKGGSSQAPSNVISEPFDPSVSVPDSSDILIKSLKGSINKSDRRPLEKLQKYVSRGESFSYLPISSSVVSFSLKSSASAPQINSEDTSYIPHHAIHGKFLHADSPKDFGGRQLSRVPTALSTISQVSTNTPSVSANSQQLLEENTTEINPYYHKSNISSGINMNFQVHNRIAGWKLTSPERRQHLINVLSKPEKNNSSGTLQDSRDSQAVRREMRLREAEAWDKTVR